jgi:hypothetical protein
MLWGPTMVWGWLLWRRWLSWLTVELAPMAIGPFFAGALVDPPPETKRLCHSAHHLWRHPSMPSAKIAVGAVLPSRSDYLGPLQ